MSNKRILKAYERFDYNGNVVPGSIVLRSKMPKNGRWKKIQEYLCCNDLITNTVNFTFRIDTFGEYSIFGLIDNCTNDVTGIIDWNDGSVEPFTHIACDGERDFFHEYAPGTYTVRVKIDNPIGLGSVELDNGQISITSVSGLSNLQGILQVDIDSSNLGDVVRNNIKQLDLSGFSSLETLNASYNQDLWLIKGLSNHTNLNNLRFSHTSVSTVDLSYFSQLLFLDLSYTNLKNVNISNCPTLIFVKLDGCSIVESDINNILITLDTNGEVNGICELQEGTNAAPTGAGIVAKNNLIAKGWTVITN